MTRNLRYVVPGIILLAGLIGGGTFAEQSGKVRDPAAAGGFYPIEPAELAQTVDELLADAQAPDLKSPLVALIAPHAGYVYSGHVAAQAYSLLKGRDIDRVVVISPCHVESFIGASVYDGDGYATPLGIVKVDRGFADKLAENNPLVFLSDQGHRLGKQGRGEHALEVQLPFLQRTLGEFELVPVVMGDQTYETCRALGTTLAKLIKDRKTLIVASTDLSHFHPYDDAVRLDQKVLDAIDQWDYYSLSRNLASRHWEACGGGPVVATMMASEREGADLAIRLKYANSGDVPRGDRGRVVGYAAVALVEDESLGGTTGAKAFELTPVEKRGLLEIAKRSVEMGVREGRSYEFTPEGHTALLDERGAFVTLNKYGRLRGCIGYIFPIMPLCYTVRDAAANAALRDRRFPPVSVSELPELEYEISVLSPLRRVLDVEQIRVGTHGLVIKKGSQEGLLLPQVAAERQWDRITFLEQTCQKAGLFKDAWKDEDTDIFAFTALVFDEHSAD